MHARSLRSLSLLFAAALFGAALAAAQWLNTASAYSVPQDHLMQPEALNALLTDVHAAKPLMLQIGSRVLFAQAHIPGSEYIGPGAQPEGLAALEARVAKLPHGKLIVLYCGCCPWNRCPNVGPAFAKLRELGFTNVKVLAIPNNLGADWVAKGYKVEQGR
jgi:thiosulfate/3-mercaptopyruvate sulfurtransferase